MRDSLSVGVFDFAMRRRMSFAYVDKTGLLAQLADSSLRVFLSRPRRFGKSLMLSTLEAMFQGKSDLFEGLAAEDWVREQAKHPSPVINLDMSALETLLTDEELRKTLLDAVRFQAGAHEIELVNSSLTSAVQELLFKLCTKEGKVVLLIDEYDAPMLDNISKPDRANAMRVVLRAFYRTVKSCEKYLRFVMVTGISKFSKTGIFSGMNNLDDISMSSDYGTLCGYTQEELERNFSGWIDRLAAEHGYTRQRALERLKENYDGFCFDGVHRVYNPWSVMKCLEERQFNNYWFRSGSPSFLSGYMREHACQFSDELRGIKVAPDFTETHEIECSTPEALLYQSGYLTIVAQDCERNLLTLDYPNKEVRDSMSRLYAESVYEVSRAPMRADEMLTGLAAGNLAAVMNAFSEALKGVPYSYFQPIREGLFCAIFMSILRIVGVTCFGEVQTSEGRSDVSVELEDRVYVFEFKLLKNRITKERVKTKLDEALRQIAENDYAAPYANDPRTLVCVGVVIDGRSHVVAEWKTL